MAASSPPLDPSNRSMEDSVDHAPPNPTSAKRVISCGPEESEKRDISGVQEESETDEASFNESDESTDEDESETHLEDDEPSFVVVTCKRPYTERADCSTDKKKKMDDKAEELRVLKEQKRWIDCELEVVHKRIKLLKEQNQEKLSLQNANEKDNDGIN